VQRNKHTAGSAGIEETKKQKEIEERKIIV
jgi:hypothetical protein